ncbi:DUF3021 domain-containing protein [Oceanobacillus caeni]|uniref:DUF3021 domain-containing protein n=1 Tax=Oceanobacillus caeni TaxID=405946 RepID=A0ABR5MHU0_9BACI|nr:MULTISPECIES: DUF3021 domain-containing protein [Bacillaceae]KPH73600.1 hypothetical protein AFL42_11815 [Oceanobacillus caeni]MBU8790575.1 DUF3021 domain-containing protein [Oceanobacillus caeni]MCR1833535.1 DUF3021 domain-containing protein [Oceanobacillus caeni]MED4476377.1 DUF3021 domain-containing protein [Oceanobacillus caeni]
MIVEAVKRSMMGIALGGIFTFIALTVVMFTSTDAAISQIWIYMLCSFILGIYFGLASFLFEDNGWSYLKKTAIHFCLSIAVYFTIALFIADWIPFSLAAILISFLVFIFVYAVFWMGYYLYYKKVEASLNASLKKKNDIFK